MKRERDHFAQCSGLPSMPLRRDSCDLVRNQRLSEGAGRDDGRGQHTQQGHRHHQF